MQRFIEFRGQDEEKNWHFGNYDQDNNEIFYTHIDGTGIHKVTIPIIPKTVGQFTGLKDVAHNKIYNGDIIQDTTHKELIYTIKWVTDCWTGIDKNHNGVMLSNLLEAAPFKIIGNIHDNKELWRDN